MSQNPELIRELAEIAASVRALAEWHASTGSSGMLTEGRSDEALALIAPRPVGGRGGGRPAALAAAIPSFQAGPAAGPPLQQQHREAPPTAAATGRGEPMAPPARQPAPAPAPAVLQVSPGPLTSSDSPATDAGGLGRTVSPAPIAVPPLQIDAPRPSLGVLVTGSETIEERRAKLDILANDARACTRCGLHAERKQAVFARGDPSSELCFVGEGPGADEDAQGLPFVGKAGQLLDKMILAMGYGRDDVYICNIVKCRPPENRKPEPNEMAACSPYVTAQLDLIKPKVIVALGATAVQGLMGTSEGITRMRGKWKIYKGKIPMMPTFHPAYVLRQPNAKRDVWTDLQEVMRQLGKSLPERR